MPFQLEGTVSAVRQLPERCCACGPGVLGGEGPTMGVVLQVLYC